MGLVNALMTREAFNARVAEITTKFPFLTNEGCEIHYVMPGWLPAIEKCLTSLNGISRGKIDFFSAQKNASGSMCHAFFETELSEKSGRYKAIEKAIEALQIDIGRVCKYCGAVIGDDGGFYASSAGSCKNHQDILSGCFEGEIKFEEASEPGISMEPDAGEVAIEALQLMFDPKHFLADSVMVQGAVERLVTFLQTTQARTKVLTSRYNEEKAEVFQKLLQAIEKKTAPELEFPKIVDTTGRVHPTMQLYKAQDLEDMWSKSQARDRKQMIEPFYKRAKVLTPARHFALVSPTWSEELNALAEDFPNFAEVIGFLRKQFALADCGDGRVHFPPLLLNGPSGIGKTFLAQTLAEMIGTSYCEIYMEKEQNGSALSGSSSYWANASPGKIADVLLTHEAANPIVVVDELDKAMQLDHDPTSGLLSLLEPNTARRFEDLCLGFAMDASAICWVFTSNQVSGLPLPILSRLKVFEVPSPTLEETIHIAHRVYSTLLKSHWGSAFSAVLPDEVAKALGQREPRVIRNVLLSALGSAAIDKRICLTVQDLDSALTASGSVDSEYQSTTIGFAKEK